MKKTEENKKQAVPVMKQLARPMSKKELASVAGAGCAPSSQQYTGIHDEPDYAF
ncbi:MAG TPA: hypothetical protein VGW39_15660 [Chthoniobacterales bacterium]|nr:hypothetical protein [Chthoniobacterales bacterium]